MSHFSRFTCAAAALLIPILFLSGCRKSGESDEERQQRETAEAQKQMAEAIFSDEIRSLTEDELAALPPRNGLPTEMLIPNALSARVIQPARFLEYADAGKVLRFLGNSPSLVPFWNQFDQLDLIITSAKVAPVSLLDVKSEEKIGENFPFPCTAVYARKTSAVDREAFERSHFGNIPPERIETVSLAGREVSLSENSLIVPLDASGKRTARIDGIATAIEYPSENEAVVVTGTRHSVEMFFTAGDGESRGVLAQRIGRSETGHFDFAFYYDYSSPQKEAITIPFPPELTAVMLQRARFASFLVNASAAEGQDALRLEIAADSPEGIGAIGEALGNTLLRVDESLGAAAPSDEQNGDSAKSPENAVAPLFPQLRDLLRSVTKEQEGNRLAASIAMTASRAELFSEAFDRLNQLADRSALNGKRAQTAGNLKYLSDVINAYYAANNQFPPLAVTGEDGTPLLSWRVELLPFMGPEGKALYSEFKLDEPWDSENNIKLLGRIPPVYLSPLQNAGENGKTLVRIFSGEGMPLDGGGEPVKMQNIENPGKTFLAVSVAPSQAVEWTRPDRLEFDPDRLGEIFGDFILALPVMGEVFSAPLTGSAEEAAALKSWITGKPEENASSEEALPKPNEPRAESNTPPLDF